MDRDGRKRWLMQGICGEPHPSIFRAELVAVREVLRIAVPPLKIYVDNLQVVEGVKKGRAWCTWAGADGADIWREVWDVLDDIGQYVEVVKVKAHTTWWDVLEGRISPFEQWGNYEADKAAKAALRQAKRESPAWAFNSQLARAFLWAKWLARYATAWKKDTTHRDEEGEEAEVREQGDNLGRQPRTSLPHEVWQSGARQICRRCGRADVAARAATGFRAEACKGAAAGRALSRATGDVNQLWYRCLLSVADMTRMGARLVDRGVIPARLIDEDRLGHLDAPGDAAGYAMGRPAAAAAAEVDARVEDAAGGQRGGTPPGEEEMQGSTATMQIEDGAVEKALRQ